MAGLPCFLGERDRDLVRIHENVSSFARDIWLVVHRDLRKTPAVRAVMDFAVAMIAENRDLAAR
jgi:DNA-binding transcriptional LysR family regulator